MISGIFLLALLAASTDGPDVPKGQVVADIRCAADATEGYALYLPSTYSADRAWPVIYAFDPGGRGRTPVERYQAAAEKYGYIVAGSNNSRNGPWEVTTAAVTAMTRDVAARFRIDARRVYTAGMSGGSRVALAIGISAPDIAGVIASSAGFPDSKPRKELPFPVFETAGTEDFNNLEMRELDRELKTPHHLAIFEGGHTWLSSELAMEAVEWMEIQAMKAGRKARDQAEADAIFAIRTAKLEDRGDKDTWLTMKAIAEDFAGLEDVSRFAARAGTLGADKRVRDAMKKDLELENRERLASQAIYSAEAKLVVAGQREDALAELRDRWRGLSEKAKGAEDTPDRRMARRVLSGLSMSVSTKDAEYLKIIQQYRMARPGR
jgi:dienelactone hydrolase